MIDIEKEIQEYCSVELEQELKQNNMTGHGDLLKAINGLSDTFKRLGKEQFKYSQQQEEMLLMLEENNEAQKDYQEIKQENKEKSKEIKMLLNLLLELVDFLEDIYRYAHNSSQDSFKEQVSMQWRKAVQLLDNQGITLIPGVEHFFNVQLHKVQEAKEYSQYPHGCILEVAKNGYLYKGKFIRKAEVTVNKRE